LPGLSFPLNVDKVKEIWTATHINSFDYYICGAAGPTINDYFDFVNVLAATRDFSVDGQPFRIWLEVAPGSEAVEDGCQVPHDHPLTHFNETELFGPRGYGDFAAWGELAGLLAVQYPHLVALNIDDLTDHISSGEISTSVLARVTANMRRHAPWLALSTATYYHWKGTMTFDLFPDLPLVLDSPKFAFRNDKQGTGPCAGAHCLWGQLCYFHDGVLTSHGYKNATLKPGGCPRSGGSCLAGSCADETVWNVGEEIADLTAALPEGRSLKVVFYATGHSSLGTPTPRYVADIMPLIAAQPRVDGIFVYTMKEPRGNCVAPPLFGGDKGCIVQAFFRSQIGTPPHSVTLKTEDSLDALQIGSVKATNSAQQAGHQQG
jgi:hypothetical protein